MAMDNKRIEEVLEFIAHKGKTLQNEEFLMALSEFLGKIFMVDYVMIDKYSVSEPTKAETVAIYNKSGFISNMEYELQHTPCENVIGCSLCVYPKNVQTLFPKDQLLVDMHVESYIGTPLWSSFGEPIGLIAIMDGKPIDNADAIGLVLQISAIKAAQELEKQMYENKLEVQIKELLASEKKLKTKNKELIMVKKALEKSNSELFEAKEKAEENGQYLSKLIVKSPLPMVITDENQDIELFNDKFTASFGYTIDEVSTAERWWQVAYPDENYRALVQNSWMKAIYEATRKDTDIGMQVWDLCTKKGEHRTCEFYMVPMGKKNLIVMNDITEKRRNEVKLSRAKDEAEQAQVLFNAFMKHAPLYAYIENEKHEQIYHNHKIWNLFDDKNYNPFSTNELFDDEQSKWLNQTAKKILKGESAHVEHEFSTTFDQKIPTEIWVKDIRFLIRMPNGRNLLGGVTIDITQEKVVKDGLLQYQSELEKQVNERTKELEKLNNSLILTNKVLNDQKSELQNAINNLRKTQAQLIQSEKMASLGVLVAGVAHEINNPVNFINSSLIGIKNNIEYLSGYATLYNQLGVNTEKVLEEIKIREKDASLVDVMEMFKRSVEIIEIGIQRTTKIVKSLKSFARSDEKELSRYNVHENIDNTLLILYNQYKNHIKIEKKYDKIPLIICYPGQINQVFMNILTNAIQAIKDTGIIEISTGKIDDKKIAVAIKDNGIGINREQLDSIFDPFFTTKKVGKGTGLGLSISYNIIQVHKGEILVESKPGKGSCFTIILPIKQIKETN